ncbi:peptide deformylase [Candidatus Kaiserbacteria bacterium RIFCSPHIGHO2_02_FULL_54_22]|uniref:Peptide deformylase n=1 Tax=Candidatus Kaiserbacteria bacterium RIFCSPHIGHO2_02_FULL_54_22 TaxID=1798495 RepID=A0A1F6DMN5_9BACT|nr:MAG: peptide deformylase [Candidatus Kaiserbacteria bacterium RIFCSPHIGHO2_02_FULL_54_22]OGG69032.1 MAG: peptide deformylase [Candidatus Kaiserbacteria bacterium RIFCSPHIGHO2_12_FULL_54_16]OGG90607.1 MAG: peptide deformylase [Candidatus Kaiserbacteria bacterium RIFCSPLOWO2_12_FULL_54_10]
MSKREIVQDGEKVLREVAEPVPESLFGSKELDTLIADMAEALDAFPEGVALAAPQVGVSWRLFIVRRDRTIDAKRDESGKLSTPHQLEPEIEVYVNPEIVKTSRKRARADEGCLSVHGVYGTTKRHERVTIKARRPDGGHIQRGAGGLMAQIFEHEIDHLNGILFTDHAEHLIRLPAQAGIPSGSMHSFAYFGTPRVASDTLALLIERGFVPAIVVTSPDAPKGRGLALTQSETKALALAHTIPVMTPENLDAEAVATIRAFGCEYAVCVAYGKIFPEELINAFPGGVLNVHYSLLPKYRGATPVETALLRGESETGVTIQKMVKELDAGDILAQETTPIAPDETARELRPRLIELGARLLVDTLPEYLGSNVTLVPQDASRLSAQAGATRAYKIKKEDGLLSLPAGRQGSPQQDLENWNKYRAYADSIGTYFMKNGKRMKIALAEFAKGEFRVLRVIPEGKKETVYKG